ncbi:MAG TPA: protein kinase [Polyangiaceae bacterium LLY-WYZ-15_(1-7)]|nr:hypothetical protein [Myxococcales bacterium]MBJ71446.1 hypothetical protein [Sandaracinus sp.]HJL02061.1 protein kinase [Polyangiaceae bacterium LLY-WYZ-15_(1-7)]HJL10274.1 protein kinase [Polyangiaceae bacterium LLY-WYZ-15_(1-7)]
MGTGGSARGQYAAGDVILGKLRVVRVLGEGGMGVVYEVEHQITKHRRALKLLHPHISENAEVTVRLLREASVAGRLRNKHVVETFDAGQLETGAAYVLMEMLEGKSFAELLEDGRPPVGRSVSLVWEACEGLAAAHREGIVHRDLKPDNLFLAHDLDGEEIVKVLDFGISKFSETQDYAGALTADGAVMGTPFYMSPEQSRGASDIDGRTDIYALGVLLYEALARRVPFIADTFPALVVRIVEGDCEPLGEVAPHVAPELAAVVHRAMATDVADRYPTVRDLQEALRPFADRALPERFGSESDAALGGTVLRGAVVEGAAPSEPGEPGLPETRVSLPTPVAAPSARGAEAPKSRAPLFVGLALLVLGAGAAAAWLAPGDEADGGRGEAPSDSRGDSAAAEPAGASARQPTGAATEAALSLVEASADPGATERSSAEPGAVETSTVEASAAEPSAIEPGTAEASAAEASAVEASAAESGTAAPTEAAPTMRARTAMAAQPARTATGSTMSAEREDGTLTKMGATIQTNIDLK